MDFIKAYLNFISPISEDTWLEIKNLMEVREFKKGDFFAKTGKVETKFGIVLDGVLRAYITNGNGQEYTKTFFTPIHFKTPISFIGALSSLVTQTTNQVMIESLTDSKIFMGDYEDWLLLIEKNKEVADWSRKLIELFFVGKERKEFEFITLHADKRYLLFRERFPELENLINQYYIAQFLGISPTQLSRIRKKVFAEN